MVLNVNQLRSFYSAAKSESITKAAEELMVTPAAITSQVKQLGGKSGPEAPVPVGKCDATHRVRAGGF